MKHLKLLLFLGLAILCSCKAVPKSNPELPINFHGRTELFTPYKANLIGPASIAEFEFSGKETTVQLGSYHSHDYVNLELDGIYKGRFRVEAGAPKDFVIKADQAGNHSVKLYKATEANKGALLFDASKTPNLSREMTISPKKRIEFIGNSITSGMGNDLTIPCGQGEWFDQHNAYFSYGPILARKLDADFLLSSVSGIGIYRNWNDEHLNEAIMPDVYNNLYLIRENQTPFNSEFQPHLVSIALGTNDLSGGDGQKFRPPFSQDKFVKSYTEFIHMLYKRYPNTRIVLLTSPMISGEQNTVLRNALDKVKKNFENDTSHKPITVFEYQPMTLKGCGNHPAIEEDQTMARELYPLFKKLLED
ncbi:SGNH/GDSL hydrolase family protein [Chryseobacterium sp. A301]